MEVVTGQIPFTPRAKKVLELSLRESLDLHNHHIGTEHLLLALVRESEGVAARILLDSGADPGTIRHAVNTRLSAAPPGRLVLQIELSITPPATGVEQLNKEALEAVQRVVENAGAQLHHAGVRVIYP